ncbi:MAG: BON domain-containing protein, partial [Edaphobacter sp.]
PPPTPAPAAPQPKQPSTIKPKPAPVVRQAPPVEPAPEVATAPPAPSPAPPVEAPAPAPPPPPPPPAFRNITVAPDTIIPIRITQTLDSATTQQGDLFTGTIATDVIVDNLVVIRQGTPVSGRVSAVQEAAHYKGSSLLTVELTSIDRRGEKIPVTTEPYSVQGKGRGANTAEKVGGGAAVGAILGGILGGGKGAAIGAAAGGGVGAGANTVTRGQQVQIASESLIRFKLTNTLALKVPTNGETDNPASNPALQQRQANPPPQ